MATVLGSIATAISNVPTTGGPANWVTGGFVDGRVKVNMDYYVALGTETTGTVIKMGQLLPIGAKVIAHVLSINTAQTSLTVSVGDLDSATRYASAATSLQTAGAYVIIGAVDATVGYYVIGSNPATPTTADNDQQIILTTGGTTLTVGRVIGLATLYTTD